VSVERLSATARLAEERLSKELKALAWSVWSSEKPVKDLRRVRMDSSKAGEFSMVSLSCTATSRAMAEGRCSAACSAASDPPWPSKTQRRELRCGQTTGSSRRAGTGPREAGDGLAAERGRGEALVRSGVMGGEAVGKPGFFRLGREPPSSDTLSSASSSDSVLETGELVGAGEAAFSGTALAATARDLSKALAQKSLLVLLEDPA
jgi:hypothetical protein